MRTDYMRTDYMRPTTCEPTTCDRLHANRLHATDYMRTDYMRTDDFDYHLPPDLIAQTPVEPRDSSRLLVFDRVSGQVSHRMFVDILDYLKARRRELSLTRAGSSRPEYGAAAPTREARLSSCC